ncbi:FAD:protein FMN transferase [Azospirillum sp.]|uniref:FAD:protein FMN transferase n=1 Tax=Azospirillum sp. TaxID=34012 RepID=UPI003D754C3A
MSLTRRRFLTIAAAAGLSGLAPRARAEDAVRWAGTALGTEASLTLHGTGRAEAARAIGLCLVELARLERIFSLFRADSTLSRLNRDGRLDSPPAELVEVLEAARRVHALSGGAFDPTVQPLWDLHSRHFATPGADPAGPDEAAVVAARAAVGMDGLAFSARGIFFSKAGMAVTLNGIAQGYVTDRIADLLRGQGFRHVLVNIGELSALGPRADGTPWRVAVEGPGEDLALDLADRAVATSSGLGTPFDASGRNHHIFDPVTGRSSHEARRVTVVARDATTADALSTALCVLPTERARACFAAASSNVAGALAAHIVPASGPMIRLGAA